MAITSPIASLPLEAHHNYISYLSLREVAVLKQVSTGLKDICNSYFLHIFGGTIPLVDTHAQRDPQLQTDNPFAASHQDEARVAKQFYLQIHWNALSIMMESGQFSPFYNTCQTYEDIESYLEVFYARFSSVVNLQTRELPRKKLEDYPKIHALVDHQLSCWITETSHQVTPGSTQSTTDHRAASLNWAVRNKLVKVIKAFQHVRTSTLKKAVILDYTTVQRCQGVPPNATIFYTALTAHNLRVTKAVLACFAKVLPDLRTVDQFYTPTLFCSIDRTDNLLLKDQNDLFLEESTLCMALTVGNRYLVRHLMMKNVIYLNTLLSICNREMSTWLDGIVLEKIKAGTYVADPEALKIKLISLGLRNCMAHLRIQNAEEVNMQPPKRAKGLHGKSKRT